jgi:hypothetical protein
LEEFCGMCLYSEASFGNGYRGNLVYVNCNRTTRVAIPSFYEHLLTIYSVLHMVLELRAAEKNNSCTVQCSSQGDANTGVNRKNFQTQRHTYLLTCSELLSCTYFQKLLRMEQKSVF